MKRRSSGDSDRIELVDRSKKATRYTVTELHVYHYI
jgi:hypothetical protein